jgi:S-adenosylmethionine:tRNA ribosyltransferase-isomerase
MHPKDLRIEDFTYDLPDDRIARYPLEVRDASKLLIYRNENISEDVYRSIAGHIEPGALMVYNQTKVVHARLLFKKPSGGMIEVFCLAPHGQTDVHTAMQQKGSVLWECMIGGASKWKHGITLQLHNSSPCFTLSAIIAERDPSAYVVRLQWDNPELTFAEILHHAGKVPLPPYLRREAEATDEARYQTLFAREEGSVAAPTAGLHFTQDVLAALAQKGISSAFVTLHVGAGTFKPVKSENMAGHDMHAEWIEVTRDTLLQIKSNAQRTIAVGTTSLRTLESLYWIGNTLANGKKVDFEGIAVSQWKPYETAAPHSRDEALNELIQYMDEHGQTKLITRTQILIAPGYQFRIADGLVTNFHQPQSTLLLLVAAFTKGNWRSIYNYALSHGFRFLSYGDGCLIFR